MTTVHRDPGPQPWTLTHRQPQAHTQHPTPPNARYSGVSLEELRRAWAAVEAGDFRLEHRPTRAGQPTPPHGPRGAGTEPWTAQAGERVLPVLGCAGSCGASTLAVALASVSTVPGTAAGLPAGGVATVGGSSRWDAVRVVECGSLVASGLAAASTSELGRHLSGWVRGARGDVLLERAGGYVPGPDAVPAPSVWRKNALSVLDVGWDLERILDQPSWIREQLLAAEHVVLATTATVPGLRRLEVHLDLLAAIPAAADATEATVHVAVLGPPRRRWPRPLAHSTGPRTRALDSDGLLMVVPYDRDLAVTGLGPAPLPTPLLTAAAQLLDHVPTAARGATR